MESLNLRESPIGIEEATFLTEHHSTVALLCANQPRSINPSSLPLQPLGTLDEDRGMRCVLTTGMNTICISVDLGSPFTSVRGRVVRHIGVVMDACPNLSLSSCAVCRFRCPVRSTSPEQWLVREHRSIGSRCAQHIASCPSCRAWRNCLPEQRRSFSDGAGRQTSEQQLHREADQYLPIHAFVDETNLGAP